MRVWFCFVISMVVLTAQAADPCAGGAAKSQQLICQHAELQELNRQVQSIWQQLQGQWAATPLVQQKRHAQQEQWVQLRDRCKNRACLQQRFQQRLMDLVSLQRSGISFMDFPVRLFEGQVADPLPDSHGPIVPPEHLPAGVSTEQLNAVLIDGEPQLAGEYAVVQSGCGARCQQQFVINLRTGQLLADTFGGPCQRQLFAYQPDSQLLIAQQPARGKAPSQWLYFQLQNNQLRLIRALDLPDHQQPQQGCA